MPPESTDEAHTWFAQAAEDLNAARHLASNPDLPPRLAAFLAHLAAVKALKIHDLVALQAYLDAQDAAVVSSDDIDVLVPWNIAGRYPADLDDTDSVTAESTVGAADRIVTALTRRVMEK